MISRGRMDFRVEISDQAKRGIAAICDWLRAQQAGDTGERWFLALRAAIASLAKFPSRCHLAPENQDSPVELRRAGDCSALGPCDSSREGGEQSGNNSLPTKMPMRFGLVGIGGRPVRYSTSTTPRRGEPRYSLGKGGLSSEPIQERADCLEGPIQHFGTGHRNLQVILSCLRIAVDDAEPIAAIVF